MGGGASPAAGAVEDSAPWCEVHRIRTAATRPHNGPQTQTAPLARIPKARLLRATHASALWRSVIFESVTGFSSRRAILPNGLLNSVIQRGRAGKSLRTRGRSQQDAADDALHRAMITVHGARPTRPAPRLLDGAGPKCKVTFRLLREIRLNGQRSLT